MVLKSSQNHVGHHILYIIGKRMTSATTMTMTKTHTKTNTKTKTKTNTKCLKDPSNAIFLKSREFKDIKYDTNSDKKYKYKYKDKDKDKNKVHRRPNICYIFEKQGVQGYHHFITSSLHHFITSSLHHRTDQDRPGQIREDQRRLRSRGPNSRTCVLVPIVDNGIWPWP